MSGGVLCIFGGVLGCLVHVSCRTYQDRPEKTNLADLILELVFLFVKKTVNTEMA